ncbi:MAG: VOC family protein [Fusobacterium sp.]|uniref:bleomycin resistance protein n=1 Tax=Fusobacterium sp. TaxID=68766 RepID=UPI0026DDB9E4|nr:VOC family protein [Fusobacterium sp.]MDO4690754.1 VOC family protein [Fusobacterium sp.]
MKYNDLIPELIVSDIDVSKKFYVDLLGFKIEYEREEDKFVFLSLGTIQLMLEEGSEEELSQMEYPFGKGINFTFGVNNIDKLYSKFKIEKSSLKKEMETREFSVNDEIIYVKEFSILDPDGYYIRISE